MKSLFNIQNNVRAIRAYYLDTKCLRTNHADYDYCLMVANTFPDERTIAVKVIQPIYNKVIKLIHGEWE